MNKLRIIELVDYKIIILKFYNNFNPNVVINELVKRRIINFII
jgi:hypothetical protein